jgi:integrase/recombinase XerD
MVRDWKMLLDKTRSDATVRNYIIKLRVVLDYLEKHGHSGLRADQVPVPKRRDKVPTFLTKHEVTQCIDATKRIKNKAIIALLYASGIRISELCQLDRGELKDGSFTVIGKGGKARLCFYDERANTLIKLYLESREDNNPALFLSDMGLRITPGCIQETFKSVRKQTGLDVHPHTLRHSFATNLLQSNTNLFHVSKLLGHAQLNTTSQYLHVVNEDLRSVYMKHHTV